jgi:hypothetical protein
MKIHCIATLTPAFFALALWSGAASATTFQWDGDGNPGGSSADFNDPQNWINTGNTNRNSGRPTDDDDTALFNGNGPTSVTVTGTDIVELLDFTVGGYTLDATAADPRRLSIGDATASLSGIRYQGTAGTVTLGSNLELDIDADDTRIRTDADNRVVIDSRLTDVSAGAGSNNAALIIDGSGTVVFTHTNNTFNGGGNNFLRGDTTTYVNNASGTGLGGNQIVLQSTATLGGTGFLELDTNRNLVVQDNTTLTAGFEGAQQIGTLTVGGTATSISNSENNNVVLQDGSILTFEIDSTSNDLIDITNGDLIVDGDTVVNILDIGGATSGTYTLIDYTGTLTGEAGFAGLGAEAFVLPEGYTGTLVDNTVNSSVDLVLVVPEPGSVGLALLGGLLMLKRGRHEND